jgi:hypothetical protein
MGQGQPGYGAPPGGAMVPMGGAPMQQMGGAGMAAGGPPGIIRNPVMVAAISYICCPFYGIWQLREIEGELNRYLGKNQGPSILWFMFALIPLLSMPKLIGEARAKAGTATQGDGNLIMYLLLGIYMIPNDVNEVWSKLGVQAK